MKASDWPFLGRRRSDTDGMARRHKKKRTPNKKATSAKRTEGEAKNRQRGTGRVERAAGISGGRDNKAGQKHRPGVRTKRSKQLREKEQAWAEGGRRQE